MLKKKSVRIILMAMIAVTGTACETIAGFFPDKEKDYVYHQELPELEIPPDIQAKSKQGKSIYTGGDSNQYSWPGSAETESPRADTGKTRIGTGPVTVRMVTYDEGSVRMQMDCSLKRAWPIVGKALSHNAIEITDRNRSEAVYFVRYSPLTKKYQDDSLVDEFDFMFGDDPRPEKEYHIRLAEDKNLTEVMVTNEEDQPLAEGDGIKLLNLLYETIKADQQKKSGNKT